LQLPEWDRFVDRADGGHHVQTAAWGRVKSSQGWRAQRIILRRNGAILGGCQLLLRRLPVGGAIAFAPRGPVMADRDTGPLTAVLDALDATAREARVVYAKVQPPTDRADLEAVLDRRGFVPSDLGAAPNATVLVDLAPEPEAMLARMRSPVRRAIRNGTRRGVTVRACGEEGLSQFGELLRLTSARQGFRPYPLDYYREILRAFAEGERARLFLVEHEGRLLSASLIVAYADTAVYKMGAWSGESAPARPNEMLHWTAMKWARERGYRFYDFDGIDETVARAIVDGRPLPEGARSGVTHFKLGFGGDARVFPRAYDRSYRRVAGIAVRRLAPRLGGLRGARFVAKRVLGRGRRAPSTGHES